MARWDQLHQYCTTNSVLGMDMNMGGWGEGGWGESGGGWGESGGRWDESGGVWSESGGGLAGLWHKEIQCK